MSAALPPLSPAALRGLASALQAGRLSAPFPRSILVHHVPEAQVDAARAWLVASDEDGFPLRHLAATLRWVADEREAAQRQRDRVELVLSPPELDQVDARDTGAVVRDLFQRARHELLIVTYAMDHKFKANPMFGDLAARLDGRDDLRVCLFVNIERPFQDQTESAALIRSFRQRFRAEIWPGARLPEVYYDPRALDPDMRKRTALHAKAIIADGERALITSANFTEAAQERNIEAGALFNDPTLAGRLRRQLFGLVEDGRLERLGG